MSQDPGVIAQVGGAAPRRVLCVEARELAPLLLASASNEARRVAGGEIDLAQPNGEFVPLADYFQLTRAHAALLLEESLGLARRPLVSGTADFVMAKAGLGATLGDAMAIIASAYNKLHGGDYNSVEIGKDGCTFRIDDTAFPYTCADSNSVTLMLECVLIYLHGAFSAIAGEDLTPALRRVASRRPQRLAHDPLNFWAAPVRCNAPWYALEYAPETAARPVARTRLSSDSVHNRVLALIDKREAVLAAQPAFTADVRQALREGARAQKEVARRLNCSTATLRRRLAEEGACFRALRRAHLNEAAKLGLLQAPRVVDVALTLGFSDCRSFTRAFKGWNGRSPQSFKSGLKSDR